MPIPAFIAFLLLAPLALSTPLHAEEAAMSSAPKTSQPASVAGLTPMQENVIHKGGTEPPFQNEYWNNHEDGIYVDRLSGEPLFSSTDKFDSGTGWPSFTKPIKQQSMQMHSDTSLGMERTEVKSDSGAHLGHVFEDGPKDKGGKRFCINSASLRFVPKAKMKEEGYGQYLYLFEGKK